MERATDLEQMKTTFGERAVSEDERKTEVTGLFDRIAPRYDLMNDLMSFGTHRLWKRTVVSRAIARLGRIVGGRPAPAAADGQSLLRGGTRVQDSGAAV